MIRLWHVLWLRWELSNQRAQRKMFAVRPELMRGNWACIQTSANIAFHQRQIDEIDKRRLLDGAAS